MYEQQRLGLQVGEIAGAGPALRAAAPGPITRRMKRLAFALAAVEVVLISPALVFMTALFVRNVQEPPQAEPAHTAQRIVMWYAAQPRLGLWVFLMAMPLAALATGCALVVRSWNRDVGLRQAVRRAAAEIRPHAAMLVVAATTVLAAAVLVIVALHSLSD